MTHTREAQIILPQKTNDGFDLNRLLVELQGELTNTFGGCTVLAGMGFWKEPPGAHLGEPVFLFTVAYAPNPLLDTAFLGLATAYGARAGQKAVYVRKADGTVEFLEPTPLEEYAPAGMVQVA